MKNFTSKPFFLFVETLVLLGVLNALTPRAYASDPAYHTAVLTDSPYFFYEFGEAAGTTAIDSSAHGFNAIYVNSPVLGAAGDNAGGTGDTAVTFTSTNSQYVLCPAAANAFGADLGTSSYEFVFATTSTTAMEALTGTANTGTALLAQVSLNDDAANVPVSDTIRLIIRDNNDNYVQAAFVNATAFDGQFHHLVWTYNAGTPLAYLDGVAQTLTVMKVGSIPSAFGTFGFPFAFGGFNNRATNQLFFSGTLDEAAIYASSLTAAQVTAHYNALINYMPPAFANTDTWTGAVNTNWDTNSADANWTNSAATNVFANGDAVGFDDTASNFVLNLSANVAPGAVTFSNSTNHYAIASDSGFSIAGPTGVTLTGPGTVTLLNSNTFTGTIAISNGQFVIGGSNGLVGSGLYSGTIIDNGTLEYASSQSQALTGTCYGTGGLIVDAPGGTLTIGSGNGNNISANPWSYTGPTVVNNGTLNLNFGDLPISGIYLSSSLTINNGGKVVLQGASALAGYTLQNTALPVTINAGGVLTSLLTNDNEGVFAGPLFGVLTLNGGTLANPSPPNATQGGWIMYNTVVVNGGANTSIISDPYFCGIQTGGQQFNVTSGGTTQSIPGIDLDFTGNFTGTFSGKPDTGLIKSGTGVMRLDGTNTYSKTTTISAGTLILGTSAKLGGGTYATNIVNNATFISASTNRQTLMGVISGTGTFELNSAGGILTLSSAETYTGPTIISGGTLALSGAATIASSSTITITNEGVLNVSGTSNGSYTMGKTQKLMGSNAVGAYAVSGSLTANSNSSILPGGTGIAGTLTFNNSLTLVPGATVTLDVSTASAADGGHNDEIIANGPLAIGSGNYLTLNALSGAANLDPTNDYLLISALGGLYGSFATAPLWGGTKPANYSHFFITNDTVNNQVRLVYNANAGPTITATSATPAIGALRNGAVKISVTVIPGASPTINSVILNLGIWGGSSGAPLVQSGTSTVWTNTIIVPAGFSPATVVLLATATDANGAQAITTISLTVVASSETWYGGAIPGSENLGNNTNWVSGSAPGYAGDSLVFAGNGGSAGLNPNLETNYSVNGVTFSNNAATYNIGSTNGSVLTLAGTVANNSAAPQVLSGPITLSASESFRPTSGNITVSGPIAGATAAAGLTVNGPYAVTLSGTNTYTGVTLVSSGTLNITGSVLNPGNVNNVGNTTAASNSVENISGAGKLNASKIYIGNFNGGAGAVYQTGGLVTATGVPGVEDTCIGNVLGAYGYYGITGGTLLTAGVVVGGEDNGNFTTSGNGLMDINGGTVSNTGWIVMSRATSAEAETSVLNLYSGSMTYAWNNVSGNGINGGLICNWSSGQTSILNIMGGTLTNTISVGVNLNEAGAAGNVGILNLNGGTFQAGWITNVPSASPTQINFNGGTLAASLSINQFLKGLTSANVFSGGGTINNNGRAITIAQPLLAPAGQGLNAAPTIRSPGVGYIAPPIVLVAPGVGDTTGVGATAIAQIDRVAGVVTNVIITSPGINYTATPTFTLSGGGSSSQAVITAPAPTPNASGGLTFSGSGTVNLAGACTYTGATTIASGTLALISAGALAGNVAINGGATLAVSSLANTTYTMPGSAFTASRSVTAANLSGAAGGSISLGALPVTLTNDGAGPSLLVLQGNLILNGNQFIINGASQLPAGTYNLVQANEGSILNQGAALSFPTPTGTAIPPGSTATIYLTGGNQADNGTTLQLAIVAPGVNLTPASLTFSVSGNNLTTGWPANQTGWRLLMQSNTLYAGLLTNPVDWVTVSGSASTNQEIFPIGSTNEVFFQLVFP